MKMLIKLDEDRILRDREYDLIDIWHLIDKQFANECRKEIMHDGSVLYSGILNMDYYTRINLACIALKRYSWFARYCIKWIWYDNDDNEELPFQEIDILARQRKINPLFNYK